MTSLDFVNRLASLCVSEANLRQQGFGDYSLTLITGFLLEKTGKKSLNSNIILQLIEEYKCANISLISPISFTPPPFETDKFMLIGWVREDLLAVNEISNEIVVLDHYTLSVNFYCAINSEKFLEAFLIHGIATFGMHFRTEEDSWKFNGDRAYKASMYAGGEKYLQFWNMLYPIESQISSNPNSGGLLN